MLSWPARLLPPVEVGRLFDVWVVVTMSAETPAQQLEVLLDQEAAAWRLVRAHVPGYDPDTVDLSRLSLPQLAAVESYLAARDARRELLHPVVPAQPEGCQVPDSGRRSPEGDMGERGPRDVRRWYQAG